MTPVDDGTEPGHQAGRTGHHRNESPGNNGGLSVKSATAAACKIMIALSGTASVTVTVGYLIIRT